MKFGGPEFWINKWFMYREILRVVVDRMLIYDQNRRGVYNLKQSVKALCTLYLDTLFQFRSV